MSKKHNNIVEAAEAAQAVAEATVKLEQIAKAPAQPVPAQAGQVVYCGPTVRGVAKQYTVFAGGIPDELENFIAQHPAAKGLLVSVERFAETRQRVETAKTAENILFHKIKSEL